MEAINFFFAHQHIYYVLFYTVVFSNFSRNSYKIFIIYSLKHQVTHIYSHEICRFRVKVKYLLSYITIGSKILLSAQIIFFYQSYPHYSNLLLSPIQRTVFLIRSDSFSNPWLLKRAVHWTVGKISIRSFKALISTCLGRPTLPMTYWVCLKFGTTNCPGLGTTLSLSDMAVDNAMVVT